MEFFHVCRKIARNDTVTLFSDIGRVLIERESTGICQFITLQIYCHAKKLLIGVAGGNFLCHLIHDLGQCGDICLLCLFDQLCDDSSLTERTTVIVTGCITDAGIGRCLYTR